MANLHLEHELRDSGKRAIVETRYGKVTGGRAANGAAVFLELPYALPPKRFADPQGLPLDYRYEQKLYVKEESYAVQPTNDGQAANTPFEDKVGLGRPTENPLFLNIVCPPESSSSTRFPVKVYIHGGFLQFGSPHGLSSQAQYVSATRSEVWVNIGYRLSVFGFLACDEPKVDGNFGFKDQWLALQWVKENIAAFGGDPDNIQIIGLSAGAHSVHQILHHASRLPEGQKAPFHSAILQSNGIATNPKTPAELRPQFQALCNALGLDANAPDILSTLRDEDKVPWQTITRAIETDALGIANGTFRGCLDGVWLASSPDPMTWQRSGGFARGLRSSGIRSVVIGDLTEEWYLYSIAHPVRTPQEIILNLRRYYTDKMVDDILGLYRTLPHDASREDIQRLFGEVLSDGQVHLPVRLFTRDLQKFGFPLLRYKIAWTPEQGRPEGYVTHGTDRVLWALRLPALDASQAIVASAWLDRIRDEVEELEQTGSSKRDAKEMLTLTEDRSISWTKDPIWDEVMRLAKILPGE
ncbi:hypothetical protein PLICRDRAFT_667399 [Plicaturopsis crispa FD-325 SS-3]|nr:hypothetical protein PLICRDRAFT_667399 [Plicaturopsis crispa FD-325 SS-3]